MVHGADKNCRLPALLAFAPLSASIALLLPVSIFLVEAVLRLLALLPVICVRVSLLLAGLGALSIGLRGGFAAFAAAATPATLSIVLRRRGLALLGRLPFRRGCLGLVLLCCHACTSWCVNLFVVLLCGAAFSGTGLPYSCVIKPEKIKAPFQNRKSANRSSAQTGRISGKGQRTSGANLQIVVETSALKPCKEHRHLTTGSAFSAFTGTNRDKARQSKNLFDCRESRRASFIQAGFSRSIG
jgi:hypothetical protein